MLHGNFFKPNFFKNIKFKRDFCKIFGKKIVPIKSVFLGPFSNTKLKSNLNFLHKSLFLYFWKKLKLKLNPKYRIHRYFNGYFTSKRISNLNKRIGTFK